MILGVILWLACIYWLFFSDRYVTEYNFKVATSPTYDESGRRGACKPNETDAECLRELQKLNDIIEERKEKYGTPDN